MRSTLPMDRRRASKPALLVIGVQRTDPTGELRQHETLSGTNGTALRMGGRLIKYHVPRTRMQLGATK
jgi:hypothetical protein